MQNHSLLAERMTRLRASPTAAISDRMRELAAAGRDVINLGEGELDFPTPDPVKAAGIKAIRDDDTKYTNVAGTAALIDAIRGKFQRDNNLRYHADQIVVGTGAKQLIFNAMLATLAPGDDVIVPAPYWVSYPDIVALTGASARIVACGVETGFKLTPEALAAALGPATRWVVINSPNNPSGAVYSRDELDALLAVLADWPDVLVMSDDIYEHLVYDVPFTTPAEVRPDMADRILTLNGVSKTWSMTGWRIGFAAGPAWLIAAMVKLQSQSTTSAAAPCQAAACRALADPLDFLPPRRDMLRTRRDAVVAAIEAIDGLSCTTPAGAFYVFADCRALLGRTSPSGDVIDNDTSLAAYLVAEAGVGLVPGSAFGTPGYLRIAYGLAERVLDDAMQRIATACAALH